MNLEILSRIPLFSVLEPYELTQLRKDAEVVTIASKTFVFRIGEPGDGLYIVESGLMEAVLDEDTESERTLNVFYPGDYFGEMALLTQGKRTASVRAIVDSRLIRISYEQFTMLVHSKPAMALHLSKVLSQYLSRANTQLSQQASRLVALIPIGSETVAWAERLVSSLVRQFGQSAIVLQLGDEQDRKARAPVVDFAQWPSTIRAFPDGGHLLRINDNLLQTAEDSALIGLIQSLKARFEYILVSSRLTKSFQRVTLVARFQQICLLYNPPYELSAADQQTLSRIGTLRGDLRAAWIVPQGTALPQMPLQMPPLPCPPIRLMEESRGIPNQTGVDRLARMLAGKTVGLALGSGTAQGLAHLGVMQTLLAADIPIDLIAGTSGGALYGSMIASGMSVEEAVRHTIRETRRNLIDKLDFTVPKKGMLRGIRIEKMIRNIIGDVAFEAVPTPLYAVATDLNTGEEVILKEGPVYQGVRASISVPGIFEPYALNGRILVDGVVVNPLPVSVARSMGADFVIAVQVPAPGEVNRKASARSKGTYRNHFNLFSAIIRAHHFVGERLADQSALDADVFIKPDVTRFGWREYRAAGEIIAEGVRAGDAALEQVKARIRDGG